MNRINSVFQQLKIRGEGALISYLPVIDVDPARSAEIADVFVESGIDLVELSIPSIMPWLDGRIVQMAHLNSMASRATVDTAFRLGGLLRSRYQEWPIVPMSDYSGIISYGLDRFIENCGSVGLDAIEVPDYPLFAGGDPHNLRPKLSSSKIGLVSFCYNLNYTSEASREYQLLSQVVRGTQSFMFLVATPGVTGKRKDLAEDYLKYAISNIRQIQIKENNNFPIVVGFGISTPEHVRKVINESGADGVVVGSAILELILKNASKEELATFIRSLKKATIKS